MVRLSVNVNKVATLRNARGGREPSVNEAVRACLRAGAPGITVHPRADERHVTRADVREIASELAPIRDRFAFVLRSTSREDRCRFCRQARRLKSWDRNLNPIRAAN